MWLTMKEKLELGEEVLFNDVVEEVRKKKNELIAIQFFFICILHISFCLFAFLPFFFPSPPPSKRAHVMHQKPKQHDDCQNGTIVCLW